MKVRICNCCASAIVLFILFCSIGCRKNYNIVGDNVAGPNPAAATLNDAIAMIDLNAFPSMKGAKSVRRTAIHSSDQVPNGNINEVVDFYVDHLSKLGWQLSEEPWFVGTKNSGASLKFIKNGYRIYVSITMPPPSTTMYVELFHKGNIDVRKLPRFKDLNPQTSSPTDISYYSNEKLEALQNFVRDEYKKVGWQELDALSINDPQAMADEGESVLKFRQNDTVLTVRIRELGVGGTKEVSTSVELVNKDLDQLKK